MAYFSSFLLVTLMLIPMTASATNWQESALKLGGEPHLRQEGINELKKIPDLDDKLQVVFGRPQEDLALAVIRSLEMKNYFPRLLGLISQSHGEKIKWKLVFTTNAIASIEDRDRLVEVYKTKLGEMKIASPALIALLEGLGKFDYHLSIADLEKLLRHPSYEVRMASIQAAANLFVKDASYAPVLVDAVATKPYQVRLHAYQGLNHRPETMNKFREKIQLACAAESNDMVKAVCRGKG